MCYDVNLKYRVVHLLITMYLAFRENYFVCKTTLTVAGLDSSGLPVEKTTLAHLSMLSCTRV